MCNRHDNTQQEYQPGRAAILVINKMAHRATKPGEDKAGLGRWCWAWLRGKASGHIRVYSGYRPGKTHGPHTIYQQHQRYLAKIQKTHKCSRDVFWDNLVEEVTEAQAKGDQVIILMDANKDIKGRMTQKISGKWGSWKQL